MVPLQMMGAVGAGAFGALFLGTGLAKAGDALAFASEVAAYRMLPLGAAIPVAYGLIGGEIGLGVWLLSGFAAGFAAVLAGGLLAVFAGAMAVNVLRGRVDLSCGCVPGLASRVSWGAVVRTVLLGVLAALVAMCGEGAGVLRFDGVLVGVALVVLALAVAHLRALPPGASAT